MTTPTQSVSVRQTLYAREQFVSGSITPVFYDSQYDNLQNENILDDVLAYNPAFNIIGYAWNGIRQVPSVINYHLIFDGINDLITVPHATSINNLPLGNFTIEWSGNIDFTHVGDIFAKYNPSTFYGIEVYYDNINNVLLSYISGDNYAGFANGAFAISNQNQHHYELVWTVSNKTFKFFVDGISITDTGSSSPYTTYDNDSSYDLSLYGTTAFPQAGIMYWFRLSNIARHSSNFTPPSLTVCPPADANTVLRLALDEGSGTIANDTSGNNNNGTITGATWARD